MIYSQGCKVNAIRHDVEQNTNEWLELRKKHVTASDSLIIMGLSPWRTRQELLEEKVGLREPQEVNSAMLRGQLLESKARRYAEDLIDTLFIPRVYQSKKYPFMLASLDGVCIDNKLILEVKCTHNKNHALAKEGKIPDYYMPQVQHQMAVCDVNQCHYLSFDGEKGVVVVVERDNVFIEKMIEMEKQFYREMSEWGK